MPETNQTTAQAVSPGIASRPAAPPGFGEFFHEVYRELVKTAMYAGATLDEAEDAASKTMVEVMPKWNPGEPPSRRYLRKAVVHNFVKEKTRGPDRVARRLAERGYVPHQEGAEDERLTVRENKEWVTQTLECLPPAQREVMECITRGIERDEIPQVLGKSPEAVRQNLCYARKRLRAELLLKRQQPPGRRTGSPREEAQ